MDDRDSLLASCEGSDPFLGPGVEVLSRIARITGGSTRWTTVVRRI